MNLEELKSLKEYIVQKYAGNTQKDIKKMIKYLDKLIKTKVKERKHERK